MDRKEDGNFQDCPITKLSTYCNKNRGSAVGIATGYGLDDHGVGVRVLIGPSIFTFPGSGVHPTSYPAGTGGSFSEGKAAGGVKLGTHPEVVPRSVKRESIHPFPICLYGVVLS
jgi:hypothetical protein